MKYDPYFTENQHDGKRYITGYSNCESNAVLSIDGENTIIQGNPKIKLRKGISPFGEEIVFELLRKGKVIKRPKNSEYDTLEIYLPKEYGLKFLKDFIAFCEKCENKGNNNE